MSLIENLRKRVSTFFESGKLQKFLYENGETIIPNVTITAKEYRQNFDFSEALVPVQDDYILKASSHGPWFVNKDIYDRVEIGKTYNLVIYRCKILGIGREDIVKDAIIIQPQ